MGFFDFFMQDGYWVYAILLAVLLTSFSALLNQYFKVQGTVLVFWSRICVVIILTPFMFFVDWPENPVYYAVVISTALFGAIGDSNYFNATAKWGAGAVSRMSPMLIFTTFIAWFFFEPELIGKYMSEPLKSSGIIAAMFGCLFFSMRLKKCEISRAAMWGILPCIVCYTITGVFNKYAMSKGAHDGVVFCYLYLQSLFVIPIVGSYIYAKSQKEAEKLNVNFLFNKSVFKVGFFASLFWIASMTFRNTGMLTIPNPAYSSALGQLSPVFISVVYYLLKHKEEGDVKSGFGIVLSALAMALINL